MLCCCLLKAKALYVSHVKDSDTDNTNSTKMYCIKLEGWTRWYEFR